MAGKLNLTAESLWLKLNVIVYRLPIYPALWFPLMSSARICFIRLALFGLAVDLYIYLDIRTCFFFGCAEREIVVYLKKKWNKYIKFSCYNKSQKRQKTLGTQEISSFPDLYLSRHSFFLSAHVVSWHRFG